MKVLDKNVADVTSLDTKFSGALSDMASNIIGQIIAIDGGWSLN